jgi:hypothetical protein
MPILPLTGGCHCGALRYQVTAAPLGVYNCHCANCQRVGGGAFATNVVINPNAFEFIHGDPGEISWTSDAGNKRVGWFCRDCGTRIAHGLPRGQPVLTLRSGTLDDRSWVNPVADFWTTSAQPWVEFSGDRPSYESEPTDFQPLQDAFRAQGHFSE